MKSDFDAKARKRSVNLTINAGLVSHAKSTTDNLSSLVLKSAPGPLTPPEVSPPFLLILSPSGLGRH